MIVTRFDVVDGVRPVRPAEVADAPVPFENDEPAGLPVRGESFLAGTPCPGPLVCFASAVEGCVVVAVGLEAGCWCEHGRLKISHKLSSVG